VRVARDITDAVTAWGARRGRVVHALHENVATMSAPAQARITRGYRVCPVVADSGSISDLHRKRLFWMTPPQVYQQLPDDALSAAAAAARGGRSSGKGTASRAAAGSAAASSSSTLSASGPAARTRRGASSSAAAGPAAAAAAGPRSGPGGDATASSSAAVPAATDADFVQIIPLPRAFTMREQRAALYERLGVGAPVYEFAGKPVVCGCPDCVGGQLGDARGRTILTDSKKLYMPFHTTLGGDGVMWGEWGTEEAAGPRGGWVPRVPRRRAHRSLPRRVHPSHAYYPTTPRHALAASTDTCLKLMGFPPGASLEDATKASYLGVILSKKKKDGDNGGGGGSGGGGSGGGDDGVVAAGPFFESDSARDKETRLVVSTAR
jgi:hypothetical protein